MKSKLIQSLRTAGFCRSGLVRLVFAVLLILGTNGCSNSGDFGGFVAAEVERIGGQTVTNAAAPPLTAQWKVQRDEDGFYAKVTGPSFEDLNRVMTHLFGAPFHSAATNAAETVTSFWSAEQVGVTIQFNEHADHAEVISVRDTGNRGSDPPPAAE